MTTKTSLKRILKLMAIVSLMVLTASIALAQSTAQPDRGEPSQRELPAHLAGGKLDAPITRDATGARFNLNRDLIGASGPQRVVVRLTQPSMAEFMARGGRAADEAAALDAISAQQDNVVAAAGSLDANAQVLARTRMALNTVILRIDASALAALAQNSNVFSINRVVDYELDLSETVPYIGATAVQDLGFDGTGVRVAVLDSGIDYTHVAFGGSGDVNDFNNNDPNIIEEGTFPTDKVVGGYDFVGSNWPNSAEEPDPDPLDAGVAAGHGTHVGDIIGGENGVAPGVDLYAVKVCSSVSTSCSGVALLQGIDFALDPDGDGNMSDAVDIINMSLGSNMGDATVDDLSYAVENASAAGVLTVASAGNGGDLPYIHGTPAGTNSALAVAQTTVPSAIMPVMEVIEPEDIAGMYEAGYQPWSAEHNARIEELVQYGDGEGGELLGCSLGDDPNSTDPADAPYPPGSLTGYIVYVDRGICSASIKIHNIAYGGGEAGVIGMVAPGEPYIFADGGGDADVPGFTITQADATILKDALEEGDVTVAFDPTEGISLVQHMVGSSSRGPTIGENLGKPDIGAPGASVSAEYGTGDGTTTFGGTSGAAPMVAGAAALVMEANPDYTWSEVKALLMNTAETNIMNKVEQFGGDKAPISRIGGGEVRVDRAVASMAAAWDADALTGSLSFGFHDITDGASWTRDVVVYNYSNDEITFTTSVDYRFAEDDGGEVVVTLPEEVTVPAMDSTTITVEMTIEQNEDHSLHPWLMNSGSQANNNAVLTFNEYDGYIWFTDEANSDNNIHMAWHVLPRGAGDIVTGGDEDDPYVQNTGKAEAYVDTFSLLATSPRHNLTQEPGGNRYVPDLKYFGVQTYPVPAGFCSANPSFIMAFAINTWERQTHADGTLFEVDLDVDGDGVVDYAIYNDALAWATDIRNVTVVWDLAADTESIFFLTTHNTNSANTVLTICGEQIGMDANDFGVTSMDASVYAVDWTFTGLASDSIHGMTIVPLGERFLTLFSGVDDVSIELEAESEQVPYTIEDFEDQLNRTETGVLWLYGPGAPADNEAKAIRLADYMLYMPAVRK